MKLLTPALTLAAPRVALFAPRQLLRIAPVRSLRALRSKENNEPPAAAQVPHIADEAAAEEATSSAKEESLPFADNDERSLMLEAAMHQVPTLGWTMDALTAGAASRGVQAARRGTALPPPRTGPCCRTPRCLNRSRSSIPHRCRRRRRRRCRRCLAWGRAAPRRPMHSARGPPQPWERGPVRPRSS